MRKIFAAATAAIPLIVAAPAFAHHMAEGMVADDVYDMIEINLADSPHLELDLTTAGTESDPMAVLTTTVLEEDVSAVLTSISDARRGQGAQVTSSLDVNISETDSDGLVTITVLENIGQGQSQMLESAP